MRNTTTLALLLFAVVATVEAQKPNGVRRARTRALPTVERAGADFFAANWNTRGAWRDSLRLDFAGDWVFPWGSNHLASVEVISWGEVRTAWDDTNAIATVGVPLAIVPGLTTFAHELTPSNSYRVAWTNAAANRDTNNLVTASIELKRCGDVTVTTNGVSWTTPRVLPFPHAGFGQDDEWVEANFPTNAAEIAAAGGYAAWVDAQVGAGQENGLYKLTVAVNCDPPETTLLTAGDYAVAVTNAGEYVFLLGKGIRYPLTASSDCVADFDYSAADDAPTGRGGAAGAPRLFAPATQYGQWSEDRGGLVLVKPPAGTPAAGWSLWTPRLAVTPQTWRPSRSEPSQTFTAVVRDASPFARATCHWASWGDAAVTVESPDAGQTAMHCNFPYESGDMIDLSLTVEVSGETLAVEYRCPVGEYDSGDWEEVYTYTGTDAPPVGVTVSANPAVVFFDAGEEAGLTAHVECRHCVRDAGTLTLNVTGGGGCTVRSTDGTVVEDGYTWSAGEDTRGARFFMVTASRKSDSARGTAFRVTYAPEAGEAVESDEARVVFAAVSTKTHKWPEPLNRRQVGVRELVDLLVEPVPSGLTVDSRAEPGTITHDSGNDARWVYKAPPAGCIDEITLSAKSAKHPVFFTVCEPTGYEAIVASNKVMQTEGGYWIHSMFFDLLLAPTNVCFDAVEILEEGLVSTNATGYFLDPSRADWLDHSLHGADSWNSVTNGLADEAGCRECPPPWGEGGSYTWSIPNWWRIEGETNAPVYFCNTDQTFELDADGTIRVRKFGWVSEFTTNRIGVVWKERDP